MAKETQKAKIERLEQDLAQAHKVIQEQNEYINKMQVLADESFSNSPYKKQLEDKIKMLEMKLKSAQDGKEHAEKLTKAKDEHFKKIEKQYQDNAYHNYMESRFYKMDMIKVDKLEAEKRMTDGENKKLKEQIKQLKADNRNLQEQNKQLRTENDGLIKQYTPMWEAEGKIIADLTKQVEELKAGTNVQKIKNERGAGRKPKFNDVEIQSIKMYKLQGKSYRTVAEMFNCSVGTIYKLINEHK